MSLLLTAAQTVGPFVSIGFETTAVPDVALAVQFDATSAAK